MSSSSHRRVGVLSRQLLAAAPTEAGPKPLAAGTSVAVTGAAGFLGGWVVKICLARGYKVRACLRNVDDKKAAFLHAMPELKSGQLSLHAGDMAKAGAYDSAFDGCEAVIHCGEPYMSFAPGTNFKQSSDNLLASGMAEKFSMDALHDVGMAATKHIIDSVNKCASVKKLVYTSSYAAMMDGDTAFFERDPIIDEGRRTTERGYCFMGNNCYSYTKDITEKVLEEAQQKAGGKWKVIHANPGDIIGPILAPHHDMNHVMTISGIIQGKPTPWPNAGAATGPQRRPSFPIDVRDCAEAHVRLFEADNVASGSRFIIVSGDKTTLPEIGERAMVLYPNYDCATTITTGRDHEGKKVDGPMNPVWLRVQGRNDAIRKATGIVFRPYEETLRDTIESVKSLNGVQPKMK